MQQSALPFWTRISWRHPQWWLFAVSVFAWLAMGVHTAAPDSMHHHHHNGASWTSDTYTWMLMVAAMMLPLISISARDVAARSLWFRRQRAILIFVLGYLSVWLVTGIALALTLANLRSQSWFDPTWAMTFSFMIAVAWHAIPLKRRALIACHRTRPVAPEGLKANLDCLRYGWMIGGSCLLNCWAWMVFCTMTGHYLAVMLFAMCIGVAERYPIQNLKRRAFHLLNSSAIPAQSRRPLRLKIFGS